MNVLFFTHIYGSNQLSELLISKGLKMPGVAVSNYEKGFLDAFIYTGHDVKTLNREFYPFCGGVNFSKEEQSLFKDQLAVAYKKFQDKAFLKFIKKSKVANEEIQNADIVVFSTYHDWRLFKYVKKIKKTIKSILLLPDLPDFIINKSSLKHRITKKMTARCFYKNIKYINCVISITNQMATHMNRYVSKTMVIEGVAKEEDVSKDNRQNFENTVLYAGGLAKKYGVLELIDAFDEIGDKKYTLVICGKGECESEITEKARKSSSIVFRGFLPREEVLNLLSKSAFLIVPECPKNDYSKYSFHSKIIEYLGSGTPVIAYMYDGIPKAYNDYILKVDGDGSNVKKELKNALKNAFKLSKDQNIYMGSKSKTFILNRLFYKNVSNKLSYLIKEISE